MNSIRIMTYAILWIMFFLLIIAEFISRSMPVYIENPNFLILFYTTIIGLLILYSEEKEKVSGPSKRKKEEED